MGFQVVKNPVHVGWYHVDYTNATAQTLYVGQIVNIGPTGSHTGAIAWTPAGVADTTADWPVAGVVVGTNNRTPLYSSDYKAEYITSVRTQAAQLARDWYGGEGMYAKGDPAALVQVAIIGPDTVLKGQIFNSTFGTAPTVLTITTGSTDGTGFTSNASEFTPVAYKATYYCRTGENRGLYRTGYDTSTTTKTFYGPNWPYDIAIGDTFVGCNLALGTTTAMTGSAPVGFYFDNSAAITTTNYFFIDVLELNLAEAGNEYAIFKFNPLQLLAVRA